MPVDLRGIRNVGDFYSQHYLDALLGSDLDAVIQRWTAEEKEGKGKAPYKALAALEQRFFKAAARAAGERDPAERLAVASDFHAHVLEALGYERRPDVEPVGEDAVVPVICSARLHGQPFLWIVEAPFAEDEEDAEPLAESPLPARLPAAAAGAPLAEGSWQELFDGALFRQDHPPRWVLLLAGADAFLIDRHKWPQGKYLHFELGSLLGLREPRALQALAGLLHRAVLLPASGQCLLDTLDENSHKHAFAVSTDLKLGAQRAIELVGNEAVHYLRHVAKEGVFGPGARPSSSPGPAPGPSAAAGGAAATDLDPAALKRRSTSGCRVRWSASRSWRCPYRSRCSSTRRRRDFTARSGPQARLHHALRSAGATSRRAQVRGSAPAVRFLSLLAPTRTNELVSFTIGTLDGPESSVNSARWT